MHDLEVRLVRLEKKCRVLFASLLITGLTLFLVAAQDAKTKVSRAQIFAVEDENGKIRAALSHKKGLTSLLMVDENEKVQMEFSVNEHGPAAIFYDGEGKKRLTLANLKDGPSVLLMDNRETARLGLSIDKNGPHVSITNESGRTIWHQPN